ncbi:MAG: TadE/TadG family type IV pilus assembly protein [Bythopirellula sp.]
MTLKKDLAISRSNAPAALTAQRRSRSRFCSGIATVELAICIPVLTLIVFGSIQATNLIFLQHAATAAAYEGSLEMAKSNATNASVQARIQQVLDARGVGNTAIAILPVGTEISRTPTGTLLTLQVTADVPSNTGVFGFFSMQNQVTGTLVATR